MRDEDRELQIKLAELQADIQINLTAFFGFLAVFIVIIIGFEQIYFILPREEALTKNTIMALVILIGIFVLGVASYFFKKALQARKQMKELRKQSLWN